MDMKKRVLDEMYRMLSRTTVEDSYRYGEFREELEDLVLDIVLALAEEKEDMSDDEVVVGYIEEHLNWIRLVNWGWSREKQSEILVAYGVDNALELQREDGLESECWRLETMVGLIIHRYLDVMDWKVLVELAKTEPVLDTSKVLAKKEDEVEKKVVECAVEMLEDKFGDELEEWMRIRPLWEDAVLLVLTGLRNKEKPSWDEKEVDFEIEWVMERAKEDEEWAKKVVMLSRADERHFCMGKPGPIEERAVSVMEPYLYALNFKKLESVYYWGMRDAGAKRKRPTLKKKVVE